MNPGAQAQAGTLAPASGLQVSTRRLSAEEFLDSAEAWRALVRRSQADPVFLGWEWLSAWWETWAGPLALEPIIIGAFHGDRLIGAAPLYRYLRRLAPGLTLRELHFIGTAPRIEGTVRSEYLDLLVDPQWQGPALDALAAQLGRERWDLISISDHVPQASGRSAFLELCARLELQPGPGEQDHGVRIDTRGEFADWLANLGRNTRLKAWNRRSWVTRHLGTLALRELEDSEEALALLNHFHQQRWGKPCFAGPSLRFHRRFLARLSAPLRARFSVLEIAGRPRSLLYDLHTGHGIYNQQAGFDDRLDARVSAGTLHLGFAIEQAFEDPQVHHYDLLAGTGKNMHYKQRFAGEPVSFSSGYQLRAPALRLLWRTQQALPWRITRGAARLLGLSR